jgi:hypothetical protein
MKTANEGREQKTDPVAARRGAGRLRKCEGQIFADVVQLRMMMRTIIIYQFKSQYARVNKNCELSHYLRLTQH